MEGLNLTPKEEKFLTCFISYLEAEPGFSDVEVGDISSGIKESVNVTKGILGSLVKRGIVDVIDDEPAFAGIMYLNENYYYLHPEESWRNYKPW